MRERRLQLAVLSNIKVYGLENTARVCRFPMSTDINNIADDNHKRLDNLAKAPMGSGHDNALLGIIVQFDLTFSVKAYTEFQRYHFADIVSSQSTMHRISKFNLDEAYMEYTDPRVIEIMKELVAEYNANPTPENYLKLLYTNPCGMKLTAGITTNYRQLRTMYLQRKGHRLPEWKEFCKELESLPFSYLITGEIAKLEPLPYSYLTTGKIAKGEEN